MIIDNRNKMIIFMILQNNNFNYEHLLEHQDKYHNQDNNGNYNEYHKGDDEENDND